MIRFAFVLIALAGCENSDSHSDSVSVTCQESLTAFCGSTSLPCPMTWTLAQDTASWGGCTERNANDNPLIAIECGNVNKVEMWGVDASSNFYYDVASGDLIAVSKYIAPGRIPESCSGGQLDSFACDTPVETNLCP